MIGRPPPYLCWCYSSIHGFTGGRCVHLCIQTTKWTIHSIVSLFTELMAAVAIGALESGYVSSCLASPSSGGMELCITVFALRVVVNAVSSSALEGADCEPSVLFPV